MKPSVRNAAPAPSSPTGLSLLPGSPHTLGKPASHQAAVALQRFMSQYIRKNKKIKCM